MVVIRNLRIISYCKIKGVNVLEMREGSNELHWHGIKVNSNHRDLIQLELGMVLLVCLPPNTLVPSSYHRVKTAI